MKLHSPVDQDFIWIAEYVNGDTLSEYDFETKEKRSFADIQKDRLIRYGLIGGGLNFFFEVFGGTFKLNGRMLDISYIDGEKEYQLTCQNDMYSDIIHYKRAEALVNMGVTEGTSPSVITLYSFGYKKQLELDGANFYFQAEFHIPINKKPRLYVWLVCDKDMNGKIVFNSNGNTKYEIDAPLEANIGGEIYWGFE